MEFVSILVPAYNEAEGIKDVLKKIKGAMRASSWDHELIVVDDGSTDGTSDILEGIEDIKLIKHDLNIGYGAALKTGIENADADYILILDGDGSYPPEDIPKILEHAPSHAMVVGARTGEQVKIPKLRIPAKFLLSRLANYLTGVRIPDLNSGMRVFKKDIAKRFFHILPEGFSFTSTLTLACLSNNHSVKYVSINYYKREGKSTIRPIKDTINFTLLIVRTVTYFKPLKVFFPAGVMVTSVGVLKLVFVDILIDKNITDLSVILTLSGIQICFFGLLADLIVKRG
jgi:glycosyltransferase involved in cell wall biosynthesis